MNSPSLLNRFIGRGFPWIIQAGLERARPCETQSEQAWIEGAKRFTKIHCPRWMTRWIERDAEEPIVLKWEQWNFGNHWEELWNQKDLAMCSWAEITILLLASCTLLILVTIISKWSIAKTQCEPWKQGLLLSVHCVSDTLHSTEKETNEITRGAKAWRSQVQTLWLLPGFSLYGYLESSFLYVSFIFYSCGSVLSQSNATKITDSWSSLALSSLCIRTDSATQPHNSTLPWYLTGHILFVWQRDFRNGRPKSMVLAGSGLVWFPSAMY